MTTRTILATVVAAAIAAIAAAGAVGSATPVAPVSGTATRSLHPVLSWTLPGGEITRDVTIARRPDTTPIGAFYDENVVTRTYGEIRPDATSWAPTEALYAGTYWWNVETRDDNYNEYCSIPWSFTIPPSLSMLRGEIAYYFNFGWAEITARYRTNVPTLVMTATLRTLRGRRIWSGRTRETFIRPGRVEETDVTWYRMRGRIWTLKRVHLTVTLAGPGVYVRKGGIVRAPGINDV